MLTTNLKGGLGNQMFQYATGRALAEKTGQTLLLDISGYSDPRAVNSDTPRTFDLGVFNIKAEIATSKQIRQIKYPLGIFSKILRKINKKILRRYYRDYHPKLLKNLAKKKNIYLDGFFQSQKNFKEIRQKLLEELSLKESGKNSIVQEFAEKIGNSNSISIHIRRGDYANDPKTKNYHGLIPLSYYEKAISTIKQKNENPVFYIFTDDISWAKENLKMEYQTIFVSGNDFTPQQEIYLMSKCQHNIIANSSFSWWGAWLNTNPKKIIIAPKKWTKTTTKVHPNIVPKSWIKI